MKKPMVDLDTVVSDMCKISVVYLAGDKLKGDMVGRVLSRFNPNAEIIFPFGAVYLRIRAEIKEGMVNVVTPGLGMRISRLRFSKGYSSMFFLREGEPRELVKYIVYWAVEYIRRGYYTGDDELSGMAQYDEYASLLKEGYRLLINGAPVSLDYEEFIDKNYDVFTQFLISEFHGANSPSSNKVDCATCPLKDVCKRISPRIPHSLFPWEIFDYSKYVISMALASLDIDPIIFFMAYFTRFAVKYKDSPKLALRETIKFLGLKKEVGVLISHYLEDYRFPATVFSLSDGEFYPTVSAYLKMHPEGRIFTENGDETERFVIAGDAFTALMGGEMSKNIEKIAAKYSEIDRTILMLSILRYPLNLMMDSDVYVERHDAVLMAVKSVFESKVYRDGLVDVEINARLRLKPTEKLLNMMGAGQ